MGSINRYLWYMRLKSHLKGIPLFSPTIRYIKWKYYRPLGIYIWTKRRSIDYSCKKQGTRMWNDNEKSLLALKDSHKGEIAFIIGNGPSLRMEDLAKLHKNRVFCFGVNRINLVFGKTEWRPNCYMAIDRQIYRDNDSTIPNVMAEKLPLYILGKGVYDGLPIGFRKNVVYFHVQKNSYYKKVEEFSDNPVKYLVDGFTVTYPALQIAYWMGFSRVYLLGVDCSYKKIRLKNGEILTNENGLSYFDVHYDPYNMNSGYVVGMLEGFRTAKAFSENKEFKIFNATRGGELDIFDRVDFDLLFI